MIRIAYILLILLVAACNNAAPSKTVAAGTVASPQASVAENAARDTIAYDTYCNARFGFCIDYPVHLLEMQPEAANGDGRAFRTPGNEVILLAFGRLDLDAEGNRIPLPQQYRNDLQQYKDSSANITYSRLGRTFYVISGTKRDGRIFYQKTVMKDDVFAFAMLDYSAAERKLYDKVTARVSASFK